MNKATLALEAKARLGECPRWDEHEGLLYWVDIDAGQLHRFDPQSGDDEYMQFDEEIGCFVLQKGGGFILAMRSGFHRLSAWQGKLSAIVDPEAHLATNRFNDGRCDPAGRFLAGTIYPPKDRGGANLYSLHTDFQLSHLESDILTSNGLAFSPDGKRMYFSDTPRHVIYRYDYDITTGAVSNRNIFHQFPPGKGRPDGAAVDSEGCYWTAMYEGARVLRLDSSGQIIQEIAVPAFCPTMVAFGDQNLKGLYITTAGERPEAELARYPKSGSLFHLRVDVAGLVEPRFG